MKSSGLLPNLVMSTDMVLNAQSFTYLHLCSLQFCKDILKVGCPLTHSSDGNGIHHKRKQGWNVGRHIPGIELKQEHHNQRTLCHYFEWSCTGIELSWHGPSCRRSLPQVAHIMLCSGQLGISNTCIIKKIGHRALEVLVYLQSKNTQQQFSNLSLTNGNLQPACYRPHDQSIFLGSVTEHTLVMGSTS